MPPKQLLLIWIQMRLKLFWLKCRNIESIESEMGRISFKFNLIALRNLDAVESEPSHCPLTCELMSCCSLQRGQGAPAREPLVSEEQQKQMMMHYYRRQEELKVSSWRDRSYSWPSFAIQHWTLYYTFTILTLIQHLHLSNNARNLCLCVCIWFPRLSGELGTQNSAGVLVIIQRSAVPWLTLFRSPFGSPSFMLCLHRHHVNSSQPLQSDWSLPIQSDWSSSHPFPTHHDTLQDPHS